MTKRIKRQLTPILVKGDADLMMLFSVEKRTLTQWRKDGMPYLRYNGQYLYDVEEVRDWIHDYCERNPNETDEDKGFENTENETEDVFVPHVDLSRTRFKRAKIS